MAKTQSVTILFCDLVASTERRARMGDDAFDEFSAELFVALRDAITGSFGREVSNAGDGMMVVFTESVADAVTCAIEMHEAVAAIDPADPPRLRVGISCGEVAQDGDNYSGMPIVEAARLESAAEPGQTLANSVVRVLVGNRRALRFRDVGALTLKGIPKPLAAVEVVTTPDSAAGTAPSVAPAGSTAIAPRAEGPLRRASLVAATIGGLAVVVIVAAIGLSHKSGATHAVPPTTTPPTVARNYPVEYVTTKCAAAATSLIPGLKCATLTVPEDRSKPHGRVVRLQVFLAPARGKPTSDPVLDFGADNLSSSPARDHSEEIQLAQRGWGATPAFTSSDPSLTCPEFTKVATASLAKPSGDPTEQQVMATAIRACHDRYTRRGIDLSKYDYLTVGDDMVDLIRELHLSHVNLVSGYVATISALEVDRRLPGVVRTMTLQEPVPGGRSRNSDPTRLLSDAFNSYVSFCQADTRCKADYPDLAASLRDDWNTYRLRPRLILGDDGDGHKHQVLMDGPRVAQAIYAGLSDRTDYDLLAAGIAAKTRSGGIDQLTAGRVLLYNAAYLDPTFSWGAQLSGTCSYDLYTIDAGHVLSSQSVPDLSGVDDGFLTWACKAWTVNKIGAAAFDDPNTNAPTLVVSGNLAPNSDQQWPDEFQQSLSHATVAVFPTMNAFLLGGNDPRCLADLRRRFLDNPSAPLATASCARQSPPIHFVASAAP
jgi:class 3 adenylate cyclase